MSVQPTTQQKRTLAQANAGQGGFQLVDRKKPGQNGSYEAFSSSGQYMKGSGQARLQPSPTPTSRLSLQAVSYAKDL
eukprot:658123-Rhodomonas_salina.1